MSRVVAAVGIALLGGVIALSPLTASAAGLWSGCDGITDSEICDGKTESADTFVSNLMDVLLWVVGSLAVIMIIFGGIKYITSGGDANKLTAAKNTILYSVIGLIVALFAYAIVLWVVGSIQQGQCTTSGGTWDAANQVCS